MKQQPKAHYNLSVSLNQFDFKFERCSIEVLFSPCTFRLPNTGQKDVENYQKEVAQQKRNSLEYRGKEFSLQRMESNSRRQKQVEIEHQNFELETQARFDVEEYIKDCKSRRRLSLAFRAKEKRRHAEWKRQEKERQIEESSRDANYRAMDQRYILLAQQKERARMAVNALRDIGCSIQGNPFADLLGS